MRILKVRNVQEALPKGLALLDQIGVPRASRAGDVLYGGPVTTIYTHPLERVMFWVARDANPFFHLYESLWMLQGRNDTAGPARYVKRMGSFSDDGVKFHGAYGHRWRHHFGMDQLTTIMDTLIKNPNDRRCVLQMWDAPADLGRNGLDFPCNTVATFQRGIDGELNLTVFCRSNDIVWGAYGANAVQFGTLLEYMAVGIGCPVGTYTQISVNWHGYVETLEKVRSLRPDKYGYVEDPYRDGAPYERVHAESMPEDFDVLNNYIEMIIEAADTGFKPVLGMNLTHPWAIMVYLMLNAHHVYKTQPKETRVGDALAVLKNHPDQHIDWIVAAKEWLQRRDMERFLADRK
jgi:thymidylate synthase